MILSFDNLYNSKSLTCQMVCVALIVFTSYFISNGISYLLLVLTLFLFGYKNKFSFPNINSFIKVVILYLLFICWLLFSGVFGLVWHTVVATTMVTAITIMIGIFSITDSDFYKKYLYVLLFCTFIETVGVLLPFINLGLYLKVLGYIPGETKDFAVGFLSIGRSSGFTLQTSIAGFYMVLGLAILFNILLFQKHTNSTKLLLIFTYSIVFAALLITGKRGVMVGTVLASFAILILNKKINIRTILIIAAVILLFGAIMLSYLSEIPEIQSTLERFEFNDTGGDMDSGRGELRELAWTLFSSNPMMGIGYGCFGWLSDKGTHNVYLQLLCETGIIGFIIFMSFTCLNLLTAIRIRKKVQSSNIWLINFSIYFQILFLIYCLVGNPLTDNYIFINYILASGIPYDIMYSIKQRPQYDSLVTV